MRKRAFHLDGRPCNGRPRRLPGWNYAGVGTYLLTLVAERRVPLFGSIVGGRFQTGPYGRIVEEEWVRTPAVRSEVELDAWVLMPDHFHALVLMHGGTLELSRAPEGYRGAGPPAGGRPLPRSLSALVGQFKATTTGRINALRASRGARIWQLGFHERVVRTEIELHRWRRYIQANPMAWTLSRVRARTDGPESTH